MSTSSLEIRTNQFHTSRSPISPVFSDVSGSRQGILIDIACIIITLLSLTLFITLAALTGYYAEIEDFETANKFFTSQNLAWFVWAIFYVIIMLYLWIRFIGLAWDNMSDLERSHVIKSTELQIKLDQLKRGYASMPLSSARSMIKDSDREINSDQNNQSNDRKQEEETNNDIINEISEKLNEEDLINFNYIKPKYHHQNNNSFGGSTVNVKYDDQFFTSPYPSNFKDNDNNSVIGTSSIPFINTNITITNDPLKKFPQNFRRQSDSSITKQRRSPSSSSTFLRNLNDSPKHSVEIVHQDMVIENPLSPRSPLSPLSPTATIFDRRRSKFTSSDSITSNSGDDVNSRRNRSNSGDDVNSRRNNITGFNNCVFEEWLLKKPTPAIPRPERLDSYRESI
ncbi:25712_t:CDS:2 [Dentiscutata erythropus]|uniref:25712_t:CDS:1 n=1 Tax=Dentiscutata erythropus TaxID=1348616 RepID=A0A9N9EWZ0_9GLOM|nr:25712_t:CDS:2 [Dentiscutata erythropus]